MGSSVAMPAQTVAGVCRARPGLDVHPGRADDDHRGHVQARRGIRADHGPVAVAHHADRGGSRESVDERGEPRGTGDRALGPCRVGVETRGRVVVEPDHHRRRGARRALLHLGQEAARLDGRVPAPRAPLVAQQRAGPADAGHDHRDVARPADVPERLDDSALAVVAHAEHRRRRPRDAHRGTVADGLADGRRCSDDHSHERRGAEGQPVAQAPPSRGPSARSVVKSTRKVRSSIHSSSLSSVRHSRPPVCGTSLRARCESRREG